MSDTIRQLFTRIFSCSENEARHVWEISLARQVVWSYPECDDYPWRWCELSVRPPLFCYQGQPVWNDKPCLSVVGSRTPMRETRQWLQRELGAFLAAKDVAVISGGARGVDQCAHRLAMEHGRPTVCVFPSGIFNLYPPGVEDLSREILLSGGALVSTFGLNQGMKKDLFHIRNRWIVGLSGATFVAEANLRSGSALSARLAREENREVATLPVFPLAHQGLGNLALLNDGATLIRDAQDLAVLVDRTEPLRPGRLQ